MLLFSQMISVMGFTRISLLFLLTCLSVTCVEYEIPSVTLQALKPKGIRVFLPDDPRIKLFLFEGIVKSDNGTKSEREIWGYGSKKKYGWVYEDFDIELKFGQSIDYSVFVSGNNPSFESKGSDGESELKLFGNIRKFNTFLVTVLEDPTAHGPHCPKTATRVRGGKACAKEVIFEDNFNRFRDDLWQIEHYIPIDHPEHPFVSYQRRTTDPTVKIENGTLQIIPRIQQDLLKSESILTATLDLNSGCTQPLCSIRATGAEILPPIASGRLTTARFAFTYGTIHIRAKVPIGDWIYPEILLAPLSQKYGSLNDASGILKIALVRGNVEPGNDKYGNKILAGGPIINAKCRSALEFYYKTIPVGYWGDDFHEYTLHWAPDHLKFSVDNVTYGFYKPGASGLKSWLPSSCRGPWYELLKTGGIIAPFDDHFQIVLGVAVGGSVEFADYIKSSNGENKPWRNRGRKASLSFWQNRDTWLNTWTQPALVIDYVKVVAL
ncbi:beta-1,3-glucan-binding protein-like isoform X1 [Danaus plexippus]|uniref:beta-1,3-glucan-binding protein-like isoform X1 n=1 Tax=Danaus plexippus TaxID=13037 RepID=UPI002AB09C27|nr:beta-1,3-glucan-binding protein-like isoform X1 [Danaus plexippus]